MSFYVKKSVYWDYFFQQKDYKDLFKSNKGNVEKQKQLFNKFVNTINLETSAFCNRRCHYCPLSKIDRKQEYIKKDVLTGILVELKDIGFQGHVCLNLYNEPLLDVHLLENIIEIKKYLPDAYILFNSNGDYLNYRKLNNLIAAGLDSMIVTRHTIDFNENHKGNIQNYVKDLGVWEFVKEKSYTPGKNITFLVNYKGRDIYICGNNWEIFGNDRGGYWVFSAAGKHERCHAIIR